MPTLMLATDSSIAVNGKPVFLPEISERWQACVMVAYRISRLGKSIPERFATRYYDAIAAAVRLLPLDLIDRLSPQSEANSPLATAFDGALALGRWIPLEDVSTPKIQIATPTDRSAGFNAETINREIEYLSRSFILKNGDVVALHTPLPDFPIAINDRIQVSISGIQSLAFNIK